LTIIVINYRIPACGGFSRLLRETVFIYAYFALLLATGLRPSEGLALEWQDVDPVRKTLRVVRTLERVHGKTYLKDPKTKGSKRTIALHDGTVQLLLEHKASSTQSGSLIFATEEGTVHDLTNVLKRYYYPCLMKAGLAIPSTTPKGNSSVKTRFNLYSLRHTHATILLKANVHPKIVRERLGHASVSLTLDTYSHVLPTIQEAAVSALGMVLYQEHKEVVSPVLN
jgi:integrase